MRKLKYAPLADYLLRLPASKQKATLTFAEIEEILGTTLPRSARKYQAWWANERHPRSHVHKVAWQDAGWHVDNLRLQEQIVTFMR